MSERTKQIVSICLIIGGLVLIVYNFTQSSSESIQHGQEVDQQINLDSLFAIESSEPISYQTAEILALFVLNSEVCPPCVNNTLDYIELLKKIESTNIIPSAIFVETESKKVRRFVKITDFPAPYRVVTEDELPVTLKDAMQELILIDREKGKIFFRLTIPGNVTTSLLYKEQVLTQVLPE